MYNSPRFQAVIICLIFISEASAQIYTAEHISKEHYEFLINCSSIIIDNSACTSLTISILGIVATFRQ